MTAVAETTWTSRRAGAAVAQVTGAVVVVEHGDLEAMGLIVVEGFLTHRKTGAVDQRLVGVVGTIAVAGPRVLEVMVLIASEGCSMRRWPVAIWLVALGIRRRAAGHGPVRLEPPQVSRAAGKRRSGTVVLSLEGAGHLE